MTLIDNDQFFCTQKLSSSQLPRKTLLQTSRKEWLFVRLEHFNLLLRTRGGGKTISRRQITWSLLFVSKSNGPIPTPRGLLFLPVRPPSLGSTTRLCKMAAAAAAIAVCKRGRSGRRLAISPTPRGAHRPTSSTHVAIVCCLIRRCREFHRVYTSTRLAKPGRRTERRREHRQEEETSWSGYWTNRL